MLESALDPARATPTAPLDARRLGVPVWTLRTVEKFLNDIGARYRAAKSGIEAGATRLRGSFLKFESADGKNRSIARELAEWPRLDLSGRCGGPPFARFDGRVDRRRADGRREGVDAADPAAPGDLGSRMTRKTRPRPKEHADVTSKRGGYCEICRTSYSTLSEHERASSHVNFVKNCSNFLSLDSLIKEGADVETFLKMNRSVSNVTERRSLRNVIKLHQESESLRRQLRIVCDGAGDDSYGRSPKRGNGTVSPGETGHYLRSKGASEAEAPQRSPRDCKREVTGNGDLSPRRDTEGKHAKVNGFGPRPRGRPPGARWRRPSPDTDVPSEDKTYYKVVSANAKLRSGAGCDSVAPPPPPRVESRCNGAANAGLVVKFRRVRRSELSVLSDEAENFMFPKRDDCDSTDDEPEADARSRDESIAAVKEEVASDDEASSDSCEFNKTRKRGRRKRSEVASAVEARFSKRRNLDSLSESLEEAKEIVKIESETVSCSPPPKVQNSLKWEDGRLKASPEVENLTFAFERVPSHEPWYDAYKRQDDGKENSHDVARYLGYYWKSPILPYEMGQLPPLKPDCCPISRLKKAPEAKPGPSRFYGTRGTKKKKIKKEEALVVGKRPRKSPREHASTLAILGGLVHKRRSKFSSSEDTKSLPSVAEEDTFVAPFGIKLPELHVPESSKKLEEFFSSLVDDDEYDTLVEHLDATFRTEEAESRPDFTEMLQNFEECEAIENAAREMQTAARLSDGRRRRRGHKFKKKNNRTGWPAKKKVQAKRDPASARSSREASVDCDALREPESKVVIAPEETSTDGVENYVALDNMENSITSTSSDVEEKTSDGSVKVEREDRVASTTEDSSERTERDTEKSFQRSARDSKDLQPVVRVQKMETKAPGPGKRRKLRSSGARRKLRTDQNR